MDNKHAKSNMPNPSNISLEILPWYILQNLAIEASVSYVTCVLVATPLAYACNVEYTRG